MIDGVATHRFAGVHNPECGATMATTRTLQSGSTGRATLWLNGLGIPLFRLPVVGPLVGERADGSVGSAIMTAILPAFIVSALVFLIGTVFGSPIVGAAIGVVLLAAVLDTFFPLLVGAITGGALA